MMTAVSQGERKSPGLPEEGEKEREKSVYNTVV